MYNFGLLKQEMEHFKDQKNNSEVMIHLAKQDQNPVKYFKILLSFLKFNKETLIKTECYPKMDKPFNTSLCNIIQHND